MLIKIEGCLKGWFKRGERACSTASSWILELERERIKDFMSLVDTKCDLIKDIKGIIKKYKCNDVSLTVFRSGKIVVENISDTDGLYKVLCDLLDGELK